MSAYSPDCRRVVGNAHLVESNRKALPLSSRLAISPERCTEYSEGQPCVPFLEVCYG